ncbi:MAG: IS630 family transposase [Candidatus Aenigmarchaeota archaeon]|nr:IS630 family transposase [Candidatus Aenigmarchaeota archaeon]
MELTFSTKKIVDIINNSGDHNEKIRLQALLLVKNGLSPKEVAIKLSKHHATIYRWINTAKSEGLDKLKWKSGRGRKAYLTKNQFVELKEIISVPIKTKDGYSRGWQSKDVLQKIKEKYNIIYSLINVRKILRKMGFRKKVCRPRNKRRNAELTKDFLGKIKKKRDLLGPQYIVVTQDECSIHIDTNNSKCWAPIGVTPIKYSSGSKKKVNISGFYTEKRELFSYDMGKSQNTVSFIDSLKQFKEDIDSKILLFIDKAPWHTSKDAKAYFEENKKWLEIIYFPTAAPDRNPTEFCWKRTRELFTSLISFDSIEQMTEGL